MLPSKRDVRKVPALRYDFAYRIAIILANLWKFVSTAVVQTISSPTLSQMLAWLNRKLASCFDGSQNVYPLDDILAGIFLNVKEVGGVKLERSTDANSRPAWMVEGPPLSPRQRSEDWQLVTRCMELSVAMYNYPMFVLLPSSNWLKIVFYTPWNIFMLVLGRLFAYLRTLLVPLPIGREIVGDGLLCKRTAAFMASSGSKISDLQFASFLNGACQTPFAIVLDHPTKSIIIAIRGSTSLVDWITDFYIFPRTVPEMFRQGKWLHLLDEMNPEGTNPPIANTEVHGGMFLTAVYIYGMAIRIISPLRDPSPIGDGRTGSYSDYKIVVTGHSLGAGVASLLTLLLRVTYMKPTDVVRGYCFSPPGCMVSQDLMERTKDLVYSIVVGDDIVPRLSIQSATKLRLEVEARINERNKRSGVTSSSSSTKNGPATVANAAKNSEYGNEQGLDYVPELFVPGHVLHLCQDPRSRAITSEWVKNESLQQIVLTNNLSMLKDHVPNRVERILKRGGTLFDYLPYVPYVTDLLESIY